MDLADRLVAAFVVDGLEELAGGRQSRVFRVIGGGVGPAVIKVLDASLTDRVELDTRLDVAVALADLDPRVCRPLMVGGQRVVELNTDDGGQHFAVCFEFARGAEPDPASAADGARMGAVLSDLHASMRQLRAFSLPVVRALRAMEPDGATTAGTHQLLHGDFNVSNLRQEDDIVRIFDLDDCGYGPPAFDVANALYMVCFDTVVQGTEEIYLTFRQSFVDGYVGASGRPVSGETLDRFIDLRVSALGSWLDDLDSAPIGIRTSSPAWLETLRSFVTGYRPLAH